MRQGPLEDRLVALLEVAFRAEPTEAGVPDRVWDAALWDVLRDFLSRPGKGVRARLTTAGWRLAGRSVMDLPPVLPLLVELIHAGSLMVDDVQDAAETRRGAPASHRIFGEPLAINAGSWLYFAPFVLLQRLPISPATRLALYDHMTRALLRCHEGQALDLAVRVTELDHDEVGATVATTTRAKTGALMRLAVELGAIAGGASDAEVEALGRFGEEAGVALQMYDDLSGLVRPDLAHKAHEDLAGECPTWAWAWLTEAHGRELFVELRDQLSEMAPSSLEEEALRARLAAHVAEHGRVRARATLDAACAALVEASPPSVARDDLCTLVRTLEAAYGVG